eukprot:TRINITY_DN74584_c0_g1_i1.p1 TRINITY_DN74584_c0_g1~~TRINITY_DN74584_c0_g1_i1.p1  ORF type:complete len:976 (-),score=117.92 TRINITY_DN74584_c0_g1_i1:28-2955(-)
MRVVFPAEVAIQNKRLAILYWVTLALTVSALLYRFLAWKKYERVQEVHSGFLGEIEVDHPLEEELDQEWSSQRDKPMCRSPQDYVFESDQRYRFNPMGCIRACTAATDDGWDCVQPENLYVTEGHESVLLVSMTDVRQLQMGRIVSNKALFSPYIEILRFHISYSFEFDLAVPSHPFGSKIKTVSGNSGTNILSVVLNQARQVKSVLTPGQPWRVSVMELLELAGLPHDWLDLPQMEKSPNSGRTWMKHPAGRLAGTTVMVQFHCMERPDDHLSTDKTVMRRWRSMTERGAICTISFQPRLDRWGYLARPPTQEALTAVTGIRLVLHESFSFHFLDTDKIFLELVSMLVVIGLPNLCLLFLVRTCLGPLSSIYKKAIRRDFNIKTDVAGMATRLVASDVAYHLLEKDSHQSGRITRHMFTNRLRKAFHVRSDDPTAAEAAAFCEYVCDTLQEACVHSHHPSSDEKSPDYLSIQMLRCASTNTDILDYTDAYRIFFDKDEREHMLANFFTPCWIREAMEKATRKRPSCFDRSSLASCDATGLDGVLHSFPEAAPCDEMKEVSPVLSVHSNPFEDLQVLGMHSLKQERWMTEFSASVEPRIDSFEKRFQNLSNIVAKLANDVESWGDRLEEKLQEREKREQAVLRRLKRERSQSENSRQRSQSENSASSLQKEADTIDPRVCVSIDAGVAAAMRPYWVRLEKLECSHSRFLSAFKSEAFLMSIRESVKKLEAEMKSIKHTFAVDTVARFSATEKALAELSRDTTLLRLETRSSRKSTQARDCCSVFGNFNISSTASLDTKSGEQPVSSFVGGVLPVGKAASSRYASASAGGQDSGHMSKTDRVQTDTLLTDTSSPTPASEAASRSGSAEVVQPPIPKPTKVKLLSLPPPMPALANQGRDDDRSFEPEPEFLFHTRDLGLLEVESIDEPVAGLTIGTSDMDDVPVQDGLALTAPPSISDINECSWAHRGRQFPMRMSI